MSYYSEGAFVKLGPSKYSINRRPGTPVVDSLPSNFPSGPKLSDSYRVFAPSFVTTQRLRTDPNPSK